MANENKKRPLVLLDAANPSTAPIDIHQTQRSGWGEVDDGAPRLTFDQVEQFRDTGKSGLADNSNVDTKPNSSPTQPNTNQASNSTQPKSSDYLWDDILAKMEEEAKAYRIRTPEEIEAQRKADKRNALFSAIGDGVSALSNLYFTTKGAPSVERGGKTLSEAQQTASDKWWKDEKEAREAYIRNRINALRTRQQKEYYDWRQQNGDDKLEADRKYKNDQIENKKREAERKERQDKFNNTIKMLATLGNITDKQQRAVQKWYEDAARGIKSEFPSDVSSAVKDALKSQFPELIDGIDFKPAAGTPAVTPVVVSTPSGKGGGKSGGSRGGGRGGSRSSYNISRDPNWEKVTTRPNENTTVVGWQRRGSGSGSYSNTKNLAKNKGL